MAASKKFYFAQGLEATKSHGGKYVEFAAPSSPIKSSPIESSPIESSPIKLSLYKRRALAKVAGIPPEGSGSHRLVIGGDAAPFTDPDGFVWVAPSP